MMKLLFYIMIFKIDLYKFFIVNLNVQNFFKFITINIFMSSDKDKRNKAEKILQKLNNKKSQNIDIDPNLYSYLEERFNIIEEKIEKVLKRID